MYKQIIFLALTVLYVSSCSRVEKVEVKEDFGEIVQFERDKKSFAKQGKLTRKNADGILIEEAEYKNDTLHGQRKLFYPTGELETIETYDHGRFAGPYQSFYTNGQVKYAGEYSNNAMNGLWKFYYETGEIKEEVVFKDNAENGPFTEYYKNGKKKAEGNYLEGGNEHGLLSMYDEEGVLVKKMDCNKGRCNTTWTKEK